MTGKELALLARLEDDVLGCTIGDMHHRVVVLFSDFRKRTAEVEYSPAERAYIAEGLQALSRPHR